MAEQCDTEQTSNIFSELFGLKQQTQNQALLLFLVCAIILSLQLLIIFIHWWMCPRNSNKDSVQTFETTKKNFKTLVRSVLALKRQHHGVLLGDWLVVKKINTNNYDENERAKFWKAFKSLQVKDSDALQDDDGRKAKVIAIDTREWIIEEIKGDFQGITFTGNTEEDFKSIMNSIKENGLPKKSEENKIRDSETPMMKMINYHLKIGNLTSQLEKFNFGIQLSRETELKKARLPFKGIVDLLWSLDDIPRCHAALEYSLIRENKVAKDWNFGEKGLRFNPIILSEDPWPKLGQSVRSYLFTFSLDITMYWIQAVISIILLKIIFSA